ncbi:MAG: hypothetical protein ACLUHE_04880 [Christensenellales bacterium]
MFAGVGASRVRDLFDQAKKTCAVHRFLSMKSTRWAADAAQAWAAADDEREARRSTSCLAEMDGFCGERGRDTCWRQRTARDILGSGAAASAAGLTARSPSAIPDARGREAILRVHAKEKPLADDVDLANIAKRTPYFAGADLENIMNEAAILCAREGKDKITSCATSTTLAIERVQMGPAGRRATLSATRIRARSPSPRSGSPPLIVGRTAGRLRRRRASGDDHAAAAEAADTTPLLPLTGE